MAFSLLLLPKSFEFKGEEFVIVTGHKGWINFECLILEEKKEEAVELLLTLVVGNVNALNVSTVLDHLIDFYIGGEERRAQESEETKSSSNKKDYDYRVDMGRIFAAFFECYGINLQEKDIHWWEFMNLLENLASSTNFVKIRGYRSMSLSGFKGAELARYKKLKGIYALETEKKDAQASEKEYFEFIQNKLKATGIKVARDGL